MHAHCYVITVMRGCCAGDARQTAANCGRHAMFFAGDAQWCAVMLYMKLYMLLFMRRVLYVQCGAAAM